jgi:hypothetical protein
MEMSQGNSLYSYFKEAKMSFFPLFFYKIGDQESKTGRTCGREQVGISGRWEEGGKSVGGEYGAYTVCTCM